MKKFAMVLLVAALAVILALSASAEYHKSMYYGVLKVEEGAITVDGQVDEAYGSEPLFWYQADGTDDPGDYTNNGNWFFTTDKRGEEFKDEVLFLVYNTENYAKGYAVWTDSALYICIDTYIQGWNNNGLKEDGSDMWKAYCVQLNLFDFAGDQNVDYGIAHMPDESTKQANFGQNKGDGTQVMANPPACNAKTTRDGEHVIYEVELKWEDFLASKPAEKDAIGIDICINLGNAQEEGGTQKCLTFVGDESYHARNHAHYEKVARYYLVTNADDAAKLYAEHVNESETKADDHSISLFGCNEVFGNFTLDTENKKAGYACLSYTLGVGAANQVVFAEPIDGSAYDSLEFELYLSDVAIFDIKFQNTGLELTSSGKCDNSEIAWNLAQIKAGIVGEPQVGWNHVVLAFKDAKATDGSTGAFDASKINFMRFFFVNNPAPETDMVLKIDNMRLTDAQKVKEEEAKKEAQEVTDRIMALSEDITKDNLAAMTTRVTRARQAYDQLSDLAKPFVTAEAVTRLKDLEKKIEEVKNQPDEKPDDPKDPTEDPKDPTDDPKDPTDDPKDPSDEPKEDSNNSTVIIIVVVAVVVIAAVVVFVVLKKKKNA